MRRTACLFVALLAGLLRTAAADPVTLTAVGDSYCPYNCAADAPRQGYMVDILKRVLVPRWSIRYELEPWTRSVSLVESGQYQILLGTAGNSDRKILVSEPIGVDRSCFFVPKDSRWRYRDLKDLERIRLGVVQDYLYDDQGPIDQLIAHYRKTKDARLEVAYGKDALNSSLRKLAAGRSDVVIENENVGLYAINELGLKDQLRLVDCDPRRTSSLHVGLALDLKDGPAVMGAINSGIKHLRQSGELREILSHYGISDWQGQIKH